MLRNIHCNAFRPCDRYIFGIKIKEKDNIQPIIMNYNSLMQDYYFFSKKPICSLICKWALFLNNLNCQSLSILAMFETKMRNLRTLKSFFDHGP